MRLRILGSSAMYPTPENPASGFVLDGGGAKLWLEAGTGTFAAFQAVERLGDLDAVVVTHAHADHCVDLFPLHHLLHTGAEGQRQLPLYCPQATWRALCRFVSAKGGEEKLGRSFEVHPVSAGEVVEIAGLRLGFERTDHPPLTLAVRIDCEEGSFAYTSDTGPGADLAPFARDVDLLLAEATYQREQLGEPVHLSAEQAGELARSAGAGALVLTHVGPGLDPARSLEEARAAAKGIPVSLARPGKVFQINRRE